MILEGTLRIKTFHRRPHVAICKKCEKPFSTTANNAQYCGESCRIEANKLRWREAHGIVVDPRHLPKGWRAPSGELHPLETEMVEWWIKGKRDEDIAELMGVPRHTVARRTQHLLDRMGWAIRASAVAAILSAKYEAQIAQLKAAGERN